MRLPALLLLAFALAGPAAAAERMMIVLDASGSMWNPVDGRTRVEVARETLAGALAAVPPEREIGLIAYGHRRKGDCGDIETLVAPAPGTAAEIVRIANGLRALGKTPLSAAVRLAAEEMRYTEDRATVVLVTDGLETCNADPCALGRELEAAGVDLTVHVVGFGLTEAEGREVACLAEATGGLYVAAADTAALVKALAETVVATANRPAEPAPAAPPEPAPEPAPEPGTPPYSLAPTAALSAEDGNLADPGLFWELVRGEETVAFGYGPDWHSDAAPGAYRLRVRLGEVTREVPVTIGPGEVAQPHIVLDAARLVLRARAATATDPVEPSAAITVAWADGEVTGYGEGEFVVPAGALTITARIGAGRLAETLTLAPGAILERDLVLGVGRVVANAYYTAGGERVEAGSLAVEVLGGRKRLDGSRESFGTLYGPDAAFDLPPGDYVLAVRLDEARAEVPFTIRAGELTEVSAALAAGVLAVTAPGAYSVEVLAGTPGLDGRHASLAYLYGEEVTLTLPAGAYLVRVRPSADGPATEAAATVAAGERTEIALP